ncbi:type I pantothenate kinase [Fructilactobacillus myrtifloralis]|uniref:Pantothenate kinase n=1 Tax=Fructilactobacillus myrtifloralis TaxID=2940301 RepID=A0ABY5BPW1_9LACO|nr:type I pantothenate kinase [Fructilactobacillus myrtifloralis]USS85682.1 type I pantothenate kinase [Fructilactobacillus myrtifloralis]
MENFAEYDKQAWADLYPTTLQPIDPQTLEHLKAFNDQVAMTDVQQVYMPLIQLLRGAFDAYRQWQQRKSDFLHQPARTIPFIIGISGSVAVGKSTTARLLQYLLTELLPNRTTQLVTTDGFLYPTKTLQAKGLLARKGFPESYDLPRLINFLLQVKAGEPLVKAPVYSHQTYDLVPDEFTAVRQPDFLIVEGINTLQQPAAAHLYVSDFTDFAIYIDADPKLIETWYLNRFQKLLQTAFTDPNNYFYRYTQDDPDQALARARQTWATVNLPNLRDYILPTRDRANLIIHKGQQHMIDRLYLRNY